MWFENANSVGSIGRKLSGVETLFMYGIECFAVLGLWRGRRLLSVWFLFLLTMMGMLALGLVVVNIGTLYRLRYPFLILLMILAARPISHMLPQFKVRNRIRADCDLSG